MKQGINLAGMNFVKQLGIVYPNEQKKCYYDFYIYDKKHQENWRYLKSLKQ
jgi:hypothetical protein